MSCFKLAPKSSPKKSPSKSAKADQKEAAFVQSVDDGTYKAPEYFQHNDMSFLDLTIDMSKYRLPQPSSKK